MTPPLPCTWPERERLALLYGAGRLAGDDLARWEAHLVKCATCAKAAAEDARWDAALSLEANAAVAPNERRIGPSVRPPAWRRWTVIATALAASALLAVGYEIWPGRAKGPDLDRSVRFAEAVRLDGTGQYDEAIAQFDKVLDERRDYPTLFFMGHAVLNAGRPTESLAYLREAAALRETPMPDGSPLPMWYVRGHVAQALIAAANGPESDPEIERLVREQMSAPGVLDASRNRCFVWTELARVRLYVREDLPGGKAALAEAEAENLIHRREAERSGIPDLDCHYVLHARFALAEVADADSEGGRRAASNLRASKAATAERVRESGQPGGYLADGMEVEAVAEMLAARRGDAADLGLALNRLDEALVLRERSGNPEGIARCRSRKAWLALLVGQPEQSRTWADLAEEAATRSGVPEELVEARMLRAQAFVSLGRKHDALRSLEEARNVRGAPRDSRQSLTAAAITLAASDDETTRARARMSLVAAVRSPLADVRQVATRVLASLASGRPVVYGPQDFGIDVRP